MRGIILVFTTLLLFSYNIFSQGGDGNPPNWCRNGHFPHYKEFKLGKVKIGKGQRSYFFKDDADDCPSGANCKSKAYLIAGNEVIVAGNLGDYSCVWYEPKKGYETVGWMLTKNLNITQPDKNPALNKWFGVWFFYDNSLEISRAEGERLQVKGQAFWKGMGDNIHTGEVDDSGKPAGNIFIPGDGREKGEYDCQIKMNLVGRYLIVSDNLQCGGANVTFTGVYTTSGRM